MDADKLLLYAVTVRPQGGGQALLEQIEKALRGGVTAVQLREKSLSEAELLDEAKKVSELCRGFGVPLIINDNVEIALKSGADGVHLGADDMPVSEARKILGDGFIIGATAKTVHRAREAQEQGADYLGVGAVFASPTKSSAIRITKDELARIAASVSIPCAAIGGITLDNMDELRGTGISGIAAVSAIFGAEDITAECVRLRLKAREVVKGCGE